MNFSKGSESQFSGKAHNIALNTVLIRADKEGLRKKVFSWHLPLRFYIKTTGFTRSVLWCSGPWNCNSEPYIAFSAAVTEVKFKGIQMYKADEIWRVFFGQIEMVYPVFQGFWFMCLYIAFSSPTVASRLLQVTCSWRWTEDTC